MDTVSITGEMDILIKEITWKMKEMDKESYYFKIK